MRALLISDRVSPGDRAVVANVDGVRFGLSICYDLRFPELYRTLALAGAEVMAVPANFTERTGRDHWEVLLRARAIENCAYVLAPAQVGGPPGQPAFGRSMIVDPWGTVVAQAADRVGIVTAELDLARVLACDVLPSAPDRSHPACIVGPTDMAACQTTANQNKQLNLLGSGSIYVFGVQYPPTDNVKISGGSGSDGRLGQIWAWTVQYTGGSDVNLVGAGDPNPGVLGIATPCSPRAACTNPEAHRPDPVAGSKPNGTRTSSSHTTTPPLRRSAASRGCAPRSLHSIDAHRELSRAACRVPRPTRTCVARLSDLRRGRVQRARWGAALDRSRLPHDACRIGDDTIALSTPSTCASAVRRPSANAAIAPSISRS